MNKIEKQKLFQEALAAYEKIINLNLEPINEENVPHFSLFDEESAHVQTTSDNDVEKLSLEERIQKLQDNFNKECRKIGLKK